MTPADHAVNKSEYDAAVAALSAREEAQTDPTPPGNGKGNSMRLSRFWTRRCHGCADTSPHDSHLTWYGRLYFRLRFKP